jgi:hypothetical protein
LKSAGIAQGLEKGGRSILLFSTFHEFANAFRMVAATNNVMRVLRQNYSRLPSFLRSHQKRSEHLKNFAHIFGSRLRTLPNS